jgi:hypothetical protein
MLLRLVASCLLVAGAIVPGMARFPALAQDEAVGPICNEVEAAYIAASDGGVPSELGARFGQDGTLASPYGIFKGRDAITHYFKFIKRGNKLRVELKSEQKVGSAVLCTGIYTVTFAPGGPIKRIAGNYTKVLAKTGNVWLISNLTYGEFPPPKPTTPK